MPRVTFYDVHTPGPAPINRRWRGSTDSGICSLGAVRSEADQLAESVQRLITSPPSLPLRGAGEGGSQQVSFEPGLSDAEFADVEARFKFAFPPELRTMLATALPVAQGFPNWRAGPEEELEAMLDWPGEGICFDVERNGFWLDAWGVRPMNSDDACDIAREHIADAPTLIPIYAHRYIPDEPAKEGNPVFSVHQSDIIHYGRDLADYLQREFFRKESDRAPVVGARRIRFWTDLLWSGSC
jgi:hypothetical protein